MGSYDRWTPARWALCRGGELSRWLLAGGGPFVEVGSLALARSGFLLGGSFVVYRARPSLRPPPERLSGGGGRREEVSSRFSWTMVEEGSSLALVRGGHLLEVGSWHL